MLVCTLVEKYKDTLPVVCVYSTSTTSTARERAVRSAYVNKHLEVQRESIACNVIPDQVPELPFFLDNSRHLDISL